MALRTKETQILNPKTSRVLKVFTVLVFAVIESVSALSHANGSAKVNTTDLSKLEMNYRQLEMTDYEDLEKKVELLKKQSRFAEALRLILARRDHDSSRGKLFQIIWSKLTPESLAKLSIALIDQSIRALKDNELSVRERASHVLILENMAREFGHRRNDFSEVLEKIAGAKIEIPDDVAHELREKKMKRTLSPSDTAQMYLNVLDLDKET